MAITKRRRAKWSPDFGGAPPAGEAGFLALCGEILELAPLSLDDSLAGLGVSSLEMVMLWAALDETYGVELAVETLMQEPSLGVLWAEVRAGLAGPGT